MKRVKVESSTIRSIRYKKKKQLLEIKFKRGGIYRYHPISDEGYKALMEAESIGKFFYKAIKNNPAIDCKNIP